MNKDNDCQIVCCTKIGNIENFYGGLWICTNDTKYYWKIEDCSITTENWEEIPESLYCELLKFQVEKDQNE